MDRKEKWLILLVVLLALVILPRAFAQETTAGFIGTVTDSTGGALVGATIEVSSPGMIAGRRVQADEAGNYRFAALPPGQYNLTVSAPGFRTYKQNGIVLTVGRLPTIDVRLEVGPVAAPQEAWCRTPLAGGSQ